MLALYLVLSQLAEIMPGLEVMPGEKRYLRTGADGEEMLLLGRIRQTYWAGLFPDGSLRIVGLQSRRISRDAAAGVTWVTLPPGVADDLPWEKVPEALQQMSESFEDGSLQAEESVTAPWATGARSSASSSAAPRAAAAGSVHRLGETTAAGGRFSILRSVLGFPWSLWAATAPLGSWRTRVAALMLGAMGSLRAAHGGAARLGLFSMWGVFVTETAETYESAAAVMEAVSGGVAAVNESTAWLREAALENPWITLLVAALAVSFLRDRAADVLGGPAAAPTTRVPPAPAPSADDGVIAGLLAEQRELRRRLEARAAAPTVIDAPPPPPPPLPPPPAAPPGDERLLERLLARLDRMEEAIRGDAGGPARSPVQVSAAPARHDADEAYGGSPYDGDATRRPAAAAATSMRGPTAEMGPSASGAPAEVEAVIARLERSSARPHDAFLRQLRRYREIPASDWPMPPGYQQRLAPSYLAEVYRSGGSGVSYARQWIREHGLQKNVPAQEMVSIMEAIDDSILLDERDVINSVAFEKLARRAYGLERAFEECWLESDWKRPEGKTKWVTKAKWDLCDRYDVRNSGAWAGRVASADEEAKQAMERDASFNKWYSKSSAARPQGGE